MGDLVIVLLRLQWVRRARRASLAQPLRQSGEALGCLLCDRPAGFSGTKALGVLPDPAQQRDLLGLVQRGEPHGVGFRGIARELGVNADRQAVAHHQDRGIAQRKAVAEELLQSRIKVPAGRLVLPRKHSALEYVRIPAGFP